jgi:hypothetical protein
MNKKNPVLPAQQNFGKRLMPSDDPLDQDSFVYISGINFHDENLNVVAKANFAQPVMKRDGDKILFKITFDF